MQKKQNNIAALVIIFGAITIFGTLIFFNYAQNDFYRSPSASGVIELPQITVAVNDVVVTVDLHVESDQNQNTAELTETITRELQQMNSQSLTGSGSVSNLRNHLVNQLNASGHAVSNVFVSDMNTSRAG